MTHGWRPVNPKIAKKYASKYPARPGIFRIADKYFGGWRAADKRWFDLKSGLMVGIEKKVGGPIWLASAAVDRPPAREHVRVEGEARLGPLPRLRHRLPLGDRRAADRGARLGVDERRRAELLGRRLEPGGASPR